MVIDFTNFERIRYVELDGYKLELFDTFTMTGNKSRLAYRFYTPTGELLFEGADLGCSPMHGIDSDDSIRALLGFLTLRPGDTDADYFDDYTPEQMAFAEGDAEMLSVWSMEEAEGESLPQFTNLDDFEG